MTTTMTEAHAAGRHAKAPRRRCPECRDVVANRLPPVNLQGQAVVELTADGYLVMVPDGTVTLAVTAKEAERTINQWAARRSQWWAINAVQIRWQGGAKPPEKKEA